MSANPAVHGYGLRPLPHNMAAEQGLLGVLLVDPEAIHRVPENLRSGDFFAPAHGRIFEAILRLHERGQVPTPVTLRAYFENDADLQKVGGGEYLAALAAGIVTVVNTGDYARQIADLALRREQIRLYHEALERAYDVNLAESARDVIESAEAQLFAIAESGASARGPVMMAESAPATLALVEKYWRGEIRGLMTGLYGLDAHMNGLFPAELTIAAGRPGMGKTAFGFTVAMNAALAGRSVLGFSLEMMHEALTMRLFARETGIPVQAMRRERGFRQEHFNEFTAAQRKLAGLKIGIDDTPALTASQIMSRARRHKRRHGLDLVIVDYLGLMRTDKQHHNKTHELEEMTHGMLEMAKRLHVPVLLLCQLNRGVESREDKRPQLSDLRDSGAIEQDADNVLFLYRAEKYMQAPPERGPRETDEDYGNRCAIWERKRQDAAGKAEIIIAKNRQGPEETVTVGFDGPRQLFYDIDQPRT